MIIYTSFIQLYVDFLIYVLDSNHCILIMLPEQNIPRQRLTFTLIPISVYNPELKTSISNHRWPCRPCAEAATISPRKLGAVLSHGYSNSISAWALTPWWIHRSIIILKARSRTVGRWVRADLSGPRIRRWCHIPTRREWGRALTPSLSFPGSRDGSARTSTPRVNRFSTTCPSLTRWSLGGAGNPWTLTTSFTGSRTQELLRRGLRPGASTGTVRQDSVLEGLAWSARIVATRRTTQGTR